MILKRMKRRHLRADAVAFCSEARRLRPDVVFGADFIAGFPTETEEMFANTLRLVDDCELTYLHVFPFSPRKGTPAARMPQVARPLVKERAARLRAKSEAVIAAYLAAHQGAKVELLMESGDVGRTPHFAEVKLATHQAAGAIVQAHVTGHDGRRLTAELLPAGEVAA
jgi:threonylcarbamoyladenosine tRNA methylthiotransferase MtaB